MPLGGFVIIKYLSELDRRQETVEIEDVKFKLSLAQNANCASVVQKAVFVPTSFKDFDAKSVYAVLTKRKTADGKQHHYACQIGAMAATKEELSNFKRISWQTPKDAALYDDEVFTSDCETDSGLPDILANKNGARDNALAKSAHQHNNLSLLLQGRVGANPLANQNLAAQVLKLQEELKQERELRIKSESKARFQEDTLARLEHEKAVALSEKAELEQMVSADQTVTVSLSLLDSIVERKLGEQINKFNTTLEKIPEALAAVTSQLQTRKSCMSAYYRVVDWLDSCPQKYY